MEREFLSLGRDVPLVAATLDRTDNVPTLNKPAQMVAQDQAAHSTPSRPTVSNKN